ncbi:MAG: hypothetical protein IKC70_08970 [Bacteroidaceae bacterium]|nr:hypothetical protein [Bacteroidaceae bacterium]
MKNLFITFSLILGFATIEAQNIQLKVDAAKQIATATPLLNGTNIEDINNQTNGGVFSQLLHGEAFEENIDTDILNLERSDYSKIYIMVDERGIPHLLNQSYVYCSVGWNSLDEECDVHSYDVYNAGKFSSPYVLSGYKFTHRYLPFDSLPENIQKTMLQRLNGNEQVSKFWSKSVKGNAQYNYELVRDGKAYMGRQTQRVAFLGGSGEVGITNHGLYRMGIHLQKDKEYDGVLRVSSKTPVTIYLSLRDNNGNILAEKPYTLKGDGSYEKVKFSLTPSAEALEGSFGISLKEKGCIDLGFAFLQPGEWGRVNGYPLRKDFVNAVKRQGIKVIRYNGSMVDCGTDPYNYRWKKMLGPIDERRITYRSGFSPYATHSFAFIEMLQFAEVLGADCIIGMSLDETSQDISDFVEYVNGSADTKWGARRVADGHPEPYNLKYIQVDNERFITRGYIEQMKKFALAAWKVDPEMNIMTSLNLHSKRYEKGNPEYELVLQLIRWFVAQGKADKLAWDPHFDGGDLGFASTDKFFRQLGLNLKRDVEADIPGFKLNLHPMEENGWRCDWFRGLAHAHNYNKIQRYGDNFKMMGTANTFQPHGLHYMWDQGRIHYNSHEIWFMPSAYIDEELSKHWFTKVVETSSSDEKLIDVTAKINDKGDSLFVYVVNLSEHDQTCAIDIDNFNYKSRAQVWSIGGCDLTETNGVDNKQNVAPKVSKATLTRKNARYTFPRYSYTIIKLRR